MFSSSFWKSAGFVSIEAVTVVSTDEVFWSVSFRGIIMMMLTPDPPLNRLLPMCLVGCVGPTNCVLYSRWESFLL